MTIRFTHILAIAGTALCLAAPAQAQRVEFGDNASTWANDGECDDPRFTGYAMADTLLDEDAYHDANDCRAAHNKGQISLRGNSGVEFGDNGSDWANDGECDDPRFVGTGMTPTPLLDEDAYHDANDCRAAYNRGTLSLR